jgi:hypothetical protein
MGAPGTTLRSTPGLQAAFPVAHFTSGPDAGGIRQPGQRPYETSGPMAVATLDGVMHLVHPGISNPLLLTETFSLSGLMTPLKPVSYKSRFGTLAEAGWSRQSPIFEARCGPDGAHLTYARQRAAERPELVVGVAHGGRSGAGLGAAGRRCVAPNPAGSRLPLPQRHPRHLAFRVRRQQ